MPWRSVGIPTEPWSSTDYQGGDVNKAKGTGSTRMKITYGLIHLVIATEMGTGTIDLNLSV